MVLNDTTIPTGAVNGTAIAGHHGDAVRGICITPQPQELSSSSQPSDEAGWRVLRSAPFRSARWAGRSDRS